METLVLERTTPMDVLFSFVGTEELVRIKKESDKVTITPIVDPADYDNDTDYLNAIPGMAEKIDAARNAPKSERKPVPREWFNV
jgi:virulence-associated protein VagC